jgi:hypothetical protein
MGKVSSTQGRIRDTSYNQNVKGKYGFEVVGVDEKMKG